MRMASLVATPIKIALRLDSVFVLFVKVKNVKKEMYFVTFYLAVTWLSSIPYRQLYSKG